MIVIIISYLHDINITFYIMGSSRFYMILVAFFCYIIIYISLKIIIDYFNPSGLIYLNMYSIYYIFFLITLLLAICFNYYINEDNMDDVANIAGLNLVPSDNSIIAGPLNIDGVITDQITVPQSKE